MFPGPLGICFWVIYALEQMSVRQRRHNKILACSTRQVKRRHDWHLLLKEAIDCVVFSFIIIIHWSRKKKKASLRCISLLKHTGRHSYFLRVGVCGESVTATTLQVLLTHQTVNTKQSVCVCVYGKATCSPFNCYFRKSIFLIQCILPLLINAPGSYLLGTLKEMSFH